MVIPFLRRTVQKHHQTPKGVPRDLPPHLMRDIGLNPWPDHTRFPFRPLW